MIAADLHFNSLDGARSLLNNLATPIYWVADIPARIADWGSENIQSRSALL